MPPGQSFPPTERIISEVDRTFGASMGHWTGDGVISNTILEGWARLNFELGQSTKIMTLSNPNVLLEANGYGTIYFQHFRNLGNSEYLLTAIISDTNYTFKKTTWNQFDPMIFSFDTPLDWKSNKAYLQLQVDANVIEEEYPPPDGYSFMFMNVSLIESWTQIGQQNYPQYLPIMGIG
jgi:hypothetical protein